MTEPHEDDVAISEYERSVLANTDLVAALYRALATPIEEYVAAPRRTT